MKIISLTLFSISITGISISTALAQANSWEGAYAQFSAGFASFMPSSQAGTTTASGATFSNTSKAKDINGLAANLSAGYNFGLSDRLILGIGATYFPGASGTSSLSVTTKTSTPSAPTNGTYNVKNIYNLFLSPGYAIDKERLVYAKLGYAGGTVSAYAPTGTNSFPNQNIKIKGTSLGLGYKEMLSESIYILGEANYAIFRPTNVTVVTNSTAIVNTNIKGNGLDLLIGIGYRF